MTRKIKEYKMFNNFSWFLIKILKMQGKRHVARENRVKDILNQIGV